MLINSKINECVSPIEGVFDIKKNKTICIIDDEHINHFIVKTIIKIIDGAIKTISYTNGEEAIIALKQLQVSGNVFPDIILLDINMPVVGGWQFLDEFIKIQSKIDKKVVIYILSSSNAPEDTKKAKTYDCLSGYFCKPIEIDTLKKLLVDPL